VKESRRKVSSETVDKLRVAPVSHEIMGKLAILAQMLPEETDWLRVKKLLMLELAPADRQLFSTRDGATKRHPPFNEFEAAIRAAWHAITGRVLIMPADKMMEDVDLQCYL